MTAEVAVLNRSGAALAADSAVTVGAGKVYDTVNKLFTLSKYHPVGVMIYNNANFMDLPWETIIKTFRADLGKKQHDTIQDYALAFENYLSCSVIASDAAQRRHFLNAYSSICHRIGHQLMHQAIESDSSNPRALHQLLYPLIDRFIASKASFPDHNLTQAVTVGEIERDLGADISNRNTAIWENGFKLKLTKRAEKLLLRALVAQIKSSSKSSDFSGVVIAGFGEKELYPSLVELNIDGAYKGKPKLVSNDYVDIGRKPGSTLSYLNGFAQTDMVQRFRDGRELSVFSGFLETFSKKMLESSIEEIVNQTASRRTSAYRKNLIDQLNKKIPSWVDGFKSALDQECFNRYTMPLLETVAWLPKPEMANLAEALVNLTSVKRKMSSDAETVGGPIDVALISKGDGFVWVKRKHYFDIELNPSFTPNYFREP